MGRLLTVSNRLPISVTKRKGGLSFQPSVGGLATGLASFYQSRSSAWIGWSGIPSGEMSEKESKEVAERSAEERCHAVSITKYEMENYYNGFSNKTIWPLFHYFPQYAKYNKTFWDVYKKVNHKFCDAVLEIAEADDEIWIHDYHLMLLPQLIRERLPNATIGFFLHIPFPSFEIFRLLPWREEILRGILGSDLIAFHIWSYTHHFLNSVSRLLGYDYERGNLSVHNRVLKVEAFPMGIDYRRFFDAVGTSHVQREVEKARKTVAERKVVLSIDRLDYTKGILKRLEAFGQFLERNRKYHEKVILIMVAVPSRVAVETYAVLKKQVDEIVGRINGKYGTVGWVPIWYLYRSIPSNRLVAFYNIADVALVTPLRDGMNLIAKEYIATKSKGLGVLILSELAGAAKELGEAIIVNPNNTEEVSSAIVEALNMPPQEQIKRNRKMQKRLERYNVVKWASDFLDELKEIKEFQRELGARLLIKGTEKQIISEYHRAKRRLLLLDYDGTLIPLKTKPEDASPDDSLRNLLQDLTEVVNSEVVLISGRDRGTLDDWLGSLNLTLVAEHGAWIKKRRGEWSTIEAMRNDWKNDIMQIFDIYIDQTPGSHIEEKDYSIVFHYREVAPELASVRIGELKDDLLHLITNLKLDVLEGNKVIEVRNAGVNKGQAALRIIESERWDFILALGDDQTDEDVFAILPDWAYSIKVGIGPTRAKFNIDSVTEARALLRKLGG